MKDVLWFVIIPDRSWALKPIHEWHAQVHKDEPVNVRLLLACLYYKIDSIGTIVSPVHHLIQLTVAHLIKHHLQTQYVIRLIINYQYLPILHHLNILFLAQLSICHCFAKHFDTNLVIFILHLIMKTFAKYLLVILHIWFHSFRVTFNKA